MTKVQVTDEQLEQLCDVFQQAALTVKVKRNMDPHQRSRVGLRAVLDALDETGRSKPYKPGESNVRGLGWPDV